MSRHEVAFAKFIVKHRWVCVILALCAVGSAAVGLTRLHFTNNYRVYFSHDNPQLRAFEALENRFTKNDNVFIVVAPADGNVFSRENLAVVEEITTKAWQVPFSNRVDSITNFQHTRADGDELIVSDLVKNASTLADSELATVKTVALQEPGLRNNLISPDGRVTAVVITVQLPRRDETTEVPSVVAQVRQLAAGIEQRHPGIRIHLTGAVVMDYAFSEAAWHDLATLVPLSFVVMVALVGILIGGVVGTLGTVLVIGFSIVIAMGLGGFIGYPVSAPTSAAPIIILTVAIANCVHILESFLHGLSQGLTKHDAVVASLCENLQPIFLASLTTVFGFLTFNFSQVPPFRQLGNLVSIGDLSSYLLSITLLPALLAILPARRAQHQEVIAVPAMIRLGEFVIRRRRALLWGMSIMAIAMIANLPRNQLNDIFVRYFDETVPFRTDSDFTVANLTGLYHVQYGLDSGETGGVSNPAFLQDVDAFANWYRQQPEVIYVGTFTDVMKRLNQNMHEDDPAQYRLPGDRELAAQYLLLYEMSLPYGLDLNNQINIDKSALRIVVSTQTLSSQGLIALNQRAEQWLAANAPAIKSGSGTGTALMFANIGKRNINAMLLGTLVALVLISGVILLSLRSVRMGLISLVPNLLPTAMGFGLWGLLVGEVGLSLSLVMSMTLGIIVDDTVHFLTKYLRARNDQGKSAMDAVRYAFKSVGRAMIVTSIVLVAGFLILSFSHFELNSGMGMLTAIVIILALVADLFLLPPLLLSLEHKHEATSPHPAAAAGAAGLD